ncbi:hypothetical protein [Roseomonas sp. BN140053]|uniref:hypothetical protein n=1 Tax=Roseomonas sp. BN140053 TaxID=3391898 RepID=UPI0039EC6A6B
MPEWISSLEWWRYAWGPLLAGLLAWSATRWKTKTDARGGLDGRLDGRMDRLIEAQSDELGIARKQVRECEERCDQCEADLKRWMAAGQAMEDFARDQRHAANNALTVYMGMALQAGAKGLPAPEPMAKVPSLLTLLPPAVPAE